MLEIDAPSRMPVGIYHDWHARWARKVGEICADQILELGLGGCTFTEQAPDVPDGTGFFSYRFREDGRGLDFLDSPGGAICSYESYDLGFRVFADPACDAASFFASGQIRVVTEPELWQRIAMLTPKLREALYLALDETETHLGVRFPQYGRKHLADNAADTAIALVERFLSLWWAGEVEASAALLSGHVRWINMPWPDRVLEGREAFVAASAGWKAFRDSGHHETRRAFRCGDVVILERYEEYTISGHPMQLDVAGFFLVRDGLIHEWKDYYDQAAYQRQMVAAGVTEQSDRQLSAAGL